MRQRCLQTGMKRHGFCFDGVHVMQQGGMTRLCSLGGLLQEFKLVGGCLLCLGAFNGGVLCLLHATLACLQRF